MATPARPRIGRIAVARESARSRSAPSEATNSPGPFGARKSNWSRNWRPLTSHQTASGVVGVVVRQDRRARRGERDVGVDRETGDERQGRRDEDPRTADEVAPADPHDEADDERGHEQRQQVVPEGEADEQAPDDEVDRPSARLPYERAMEEQGAQEQVERVDLGDRRRRPDRPDDAEREGAGDRQEWPHAEALGDRADRGERGRDEERREQVELERDRPERDELDEPGQHDVGRVARRVGDAEDVGHGLHLAPVAEGDPGEQRPHVEHQGDGGDDGRREAGHWVAARSTADRRAGSGLVRCHQRMVAGGGVRAGPPRACHSGSIGHEPRDAMPGPR